MPLTDTAIRKLKPEAKAYGLADSAGLFRWVTPVGGNTWRWKYRVVAAENSFAAVANAWHVAWKGTKSARHADYVLRRIDPGIRCCFSQGNATTKNP